MMVLSDGGGVGSLPSSSSNASGVGATTDVRKQQRGRGEVAARSSSSSSSSSSVGSRRAVRVVAPTMVILATLLAANLLVLGVQVWRFLPPPSDRDDDDEDGQEGENSYIEEQDYSDNPELGGRKLFKINDGMCSIMSKKRKS